MTSRIAYLGPSGTFTHLAAEQIWESAAELLPSATVPEVVDRVRWGDCDFGVVPMENPVEGVVTASVDQLVFGTGDVVVLREISLRTSFDVYRAAGGSGPPTGIASHPHGLAQCTRYVNASGLPTRSFPSTAAAVEATAADPGLLAIAAPDLASRYAVTLVDSGVEDHAGAYNRFGCLGSRRRQAELPASADELSWKTLLALTPATRPGTLADVCNQFSDQGVNILSMTSRPLPGFTGAYVFVLAVADSRTSAGLARAVNGLLYTGVRVKFLGSFLSDHLLRPSRPDRPLSAPTGSFGLRDLHEVSAVFPGR
ncbi:MAG: prephenate dehydratase [Hamadaea sp.]|uniref:prephenate dehydratase n=1 Tax=Hamadaea sp. TaxID=2024425 RepID=UPI00185794BF|nr:prephenate dehydratase domain-containing protein [Hamadaea sp.]NUR71492.1 prephenate dehydratase [Hamadaea sp.]NUT22153.1 prephenate dehydratase [Hamadaea sp.]